MTFKPWSLTSDVLTERTFAPGQSIGVSRWLLLGRCHEQGDWEFLFGSPGTYEIGFPTQGEATVKISVEEPRRHIDRAAMEMIDVPAAMVLLGETLDAEPGVSTLTMLCKRVSESVYAPYAALGIATYLGKTMGYRQGFHQYMPHLEFIVGGHRHSPVREEAVYLMAKGYAHRGQPEEVAKCVQLLEEDYPSGRYLPVAKRSLSTYVHTRTRPRENVLGTGKTRTAELKIVGVERIPRGPRETYRAYWEGFAAHRLGESLGYLHDDYMGSVGTKAAKKERLEAESRRRRIESVRLEIMGCRSIDSYVWPATSVADRRSWSGQMCLLSAHITLRKSILNTGEQLVDELLLDTVLSKSSGRWVILSERARPTPRALRAEALAHKLFTSLSTSFERVTVSEGTSRISLYERVRSHVAHGTKDTKLSWRTLGVRMIGPPAYGAELLGEVTLRRGGNTDEVTGLTRYSVTFVMTLAQDALHLKETICERVAASPARDGVEGVRSPFTI